MSKITHAEVRMYKMGTGDCFVIKFFEDNVVSCKIMIDAGTWSGTAASLENYIKDLKTYVDNYVDVLIVTHEHKDHVHAFSACKTLFTDGTFKVGEIWMGWPEKDGIRKVEEWKDEYGQKKKALGRVAKALETARASEEFTKQFEGSSNSARMLTAREHFSKVLNGFAELHLDKDANNLYTGGLAGMEVVKNDIDKKEIKYFKPGDVIRDVGNAEGLKIYVLGPPELYDDVKKEAGGEGDSYLHNKVLKESDAFGAAILNLDSGGFIDSNVLPFEEFYTDKHKSVPVPDNVPDNLLTEEQRAAKEEMKYMNNMKKLYETNWRKIDFEWLYSAGSFALRMNGLTNNLSLAIAIEFTKTGRVMLFPGDAEFGSWSSWHNINWVDDDREEKNKDRKELKHLTEDLLNRTVFYKVAHHLSHNGTAQKKGLEMMKHKDLAAMATLDYNIINDGWTSTMPNRALLKELLLRTKGRLMIMNEEKLFFDFNEEVPLGDKIKEARSQLSAKEKAAFDDDFESEQLYLQYKVKA